MKRLVRTDCEHYRGSRPCDPHKEQGEVCDGCTYYKPIQQRVAIVKLGAMGDVLRTTSLLPDILAVHANSHLTWFTLPESVPMLRSVSQIHRVVDVSTSGGFVEGLSFDVVYNFDNADEGVSLTQALHAEEKRGFKPGPLGHCDGVFPGGDPTLYELGLWDDLKRHNKQSYLRLLASSAGLSYSGGLPHIALNESDLAKAEGAYAGFPTPRIGINTDAGTRWMRKQWNLPYVEEAVSALVSRGYGITLFGGPKLEAFNETLADRYPSSVRVARTSSSVLALFAEISHLDVLLTGDTLAMHAAWALSVPIVALFGPTSAAEIDLAPDDIKLVATDLDCLACYRHTCAVNPNCMDRLVPNLVISAVEHRLQQATMREVCS